MAEARDVLTRPAPAPDLTLAYGPHPDHVIDVRLPGHLPAPIVVMVHGGFWRAAFDRTHTGPMASALAAAGYVVATPEYRRVGQDGGGWPGTFDDVAAALDAVPGLLAPYGTEPPIWVGHSAGGHLVLWAATRPGAVTRAVIPLGACADLMLAAELRLGDGATQALLGGGPDEVPDRYAAADPAVLPRPAVPVTLVHGADDQVVPIKVARSYAERAGAALHELPGTGHFALIDPLSPAWPRVLEALPGRP